MKTGQFNINEYLEKLYEEATPMMDGGENLTNADGILIPDTNQKSYNWLKKEYQAGQTEVKVEVNMGGAKFEPGYDLQTKLDSVKDFKPGMFGEVKTQEKEQKPTQEKEDKKPSLDTKKDQPTFTKSEGKAIKKEETPKTNDTEKNIKTKDESGKEKEESEEPKKSDKTEVKKIDLKTKKK